MDDKTFTQFIRAVEADQGHAAFLLGLRHNAALQYHATNVVTLESMSDEAFLRDAPQLYPQPFAEVQRVAEQCEQLSEALGKNVMNLQAVDLFRSVVDLAKVQESVQPVEEAGMKVKCPKCGNEFAVKSAGDDKTDKEA